MSSSPASFTPAYLFRFGTVQFDEARLELQVGGLKVDLEQRPLQLLLSLLAHPDEVVTKQELLDSVWDGRPTVDNVIANAVAKLRKALGADGERIVTIPRVGYRIAGPIERIAAGRRLDSQLELTAGIPVPSREHFLLQRQLGSARGHEVWLAQHRKTREQRVYKFSADGETLALLKREATLYRVLNESLGERDDFVRILDWNFETPPFFLECAYGGVNLAEWSRNDSALTSLGFDGCLALFLKIADAVAAAHSVGVLHKDLKPANILVAQQADGALSIRLTDFGSGRLLEPGRLQELGITQLGLTVTQQAGDTSGTPLYLAPEILAGQSPTVQSDLYALGVMLYQLMAGDFRKPMTPGWERDIDDALMRQDIAAATDGNPSRRLKSVAELIEHLRNRDARIRKLQQRRESEQRALATERALQISRARRPWLIALVCALVAGLGVSLWFYLQSVETTRRLAQQMKVEAAVNQFVTHDLIGAANPAIRGRSDVTVVDALHAAMPRIDTAFASASPEIQAALHYALQESLAGLTDSQASIDEGRKAIAAYLRTRPLDLRGLCAARIRLARDLMRIAREKEVPALLDRVQADLQRLAPQDPVLQIKLWQARSVLQANHLHVQESLALDRKSWALLQTIADPSPELRDSVQFDLADSLTLTGQLKEAEHFLRDLVSRQARTLGPHHQQTLYSTVVLANNLIRQQRWDEAAAMLPNAVDGLEHALGPEHGRTLLAKHVLGIVYLYTRQYPRAVALYQNIYRDMAARFGDNYQGTMAIQESLGLALQYDGRLQAAEKTLRRTLKIARGEFEADNPEIEHLSYSLADCLLEQNRIGEAEILLKGLSIAILKSSEQTDDWAARLDYEHARIALAKHDRQTARRLLEHAQKVLTDPNVRRIDALPTKIAALTTKLAIPAR